MHSSSGHRSVNNNNNIETNNVRRNHIMRSTTRAIALTVTLAIATSTTPAFASAEGRGPRLRDRDTIVRVIKRAIKRAFGISTTETPTIPIPAPTQP